MLPDYQVLAKMLHGHLEDQIGLADSKAYLSMVASAVLIGAAATMGVSTLTKLMSPTTALALMISGLLTLATLMLLLVSLFLALLAIKPRVHRSGDAQETMFFYGTIASQPQDAFIQSFTARTVDDVVRILLQECYSKSRILTNKFDLSRRSINVLLLSLTMWALSIIFLAIGSR